jgi:hypothetical protein
VNPTVAALLIAAADPTPDPFSPLLGQGILGVVTLLTMAGCRYVINEVRASRDREVAALREELTRAIKDRDEMRDRLATSTAFIATEVIPLFTRTTDLSRAQLAALHRTPGDSM